MIPSRMPWRLTAPLTVLAILLSAGLPARTAAQQLPHPRDMGFRDLEIQIPDTARFEFRLDNGLSGFAVQDARVPLVQFSAFVRAGTGDGDRQGLAEALAFLLRRGPCWMGPNSFDEALDRIAGELTINVSEDLTEVTLNVPAGDASQGMRLFSGILRAPCIEPEGLDAFRAVQPPPTTRPPGVAVHDASMEVAVRLFKRRLFESHEYSDVITGEEAQRLTVEDVTRFHRDYFNPTNLVLAVSGSVNANAMLREVDQRFADWEARRPPSLRTGTEITTPPRAVYRYQSDKRQTWIVIGHELPRVSPDDRPALEVMNYILGGGHFDTRLFREARDKRGLTNDASGFLEFNTRGPGTYTFRTSGRHEVADQLIDIVFGEIERIRTELVSEEELEVAKGALTDGAFSMRFENGHAVARTFATELVSYGTFEHLFEYVRRVRDVSREDVRRAAQTYLHPERMAVVVVGQ
jgi:zinc protease